jgi:hypothetical protein
MRLLRTRNALAPATVLLAALVLGATTVPPARAALRERAGSPAQPTVRADEHTARYAIDTAFREGRLSYEDMILLKAYSLYAPERLRGAYRGQAPDKCGTPTAREIERALPTLPRAAADEIRALRARPVCSTTTDTPHFRLHYDTTGTHMIYGWPNTAYRDSLAVALENAWTQEVTGMGFRQPPSDGGDPDGGGGNALYDVYVQNLESYYGYTQGTYTVPSTPRTDCTSYVVVENDYAGFGYANPIDPLNVTVAHEFNHACQFSHDYSESDWYMECTSTWAEDVVYDAVNDYRGYLFYFMNYPYNSLEWDDPTGLRIYGSCVWNQFLSEYFSVDVVPDAWYQCETMTEYDAQNSVLATNYASSLAEAFETFAVWIWFTGSRDDGNHFGEGAFWPLVAAERTYSTYPIAGGAPIVAHRPDHLAWNYVHLTNPGGAEDLLDVTYDGPDPTSTLNYVSLNVRSSDGVKSEYGEMTLDAYGNGNSTVTEWNDLDLVCVAVVNASRASDNMSYTINVDRSTPVEGSFVASVVEPSAVTLRWTLAAPEDIVSLDVSRATSSDGEFEVINDEPLDPASPGAYVDTDVRAGDELWYRLDATMVGGAVELLGSGPVHARVPGTLGLALSPPSPNPFSGSAQLEFTVPGEDSPVRVSVYDVSGRLVVTLVDGPLGRGRHTCAWDGRDARGRAVAAGVYFCSLEVPGAVVTQKAIVVR